MRLIRARVQKYRSVRDSGVFEIDPMKTILVGPNEAGKSALLQALQQLNPAKDVKKFDVLRDYPRSEYNDITRGIVKPENVEAVTGWFVLDDGDKELVSEQFRNCEYQYTRKLDNSATHQLIGGPNIPTLSEIENNLRRLAAHADSKVQPGAADQPTVETPTQSLSKLLNGVAGTARVRKDLANNLIDWLNKILPLVDESNATETKRLLSLQNQCKVAESINATLTLLESRRPIFVLFSNYFRVRPNMHLENLAKRIEAKTLDDEQYDYGNQCLLKLLGFTARQLADMGNVSEPTDAAAFQNYRDQLDKRAYQLNGASVKLTQEIVKVWQPDNSRDEAAKVKMLADRQYLKVVVEDGLGVEIELDQRSEGFQWLVSFFVVFFAETHGKHKNAVLLLDEPGLSLHGLKQREFRRTLSLLSESNQTLYSTHSPFLVGPDELDLVRVVEMTDRIIGTKVLTSVTANDAAGLLPLQEALGYDLAQTLFIKDRNLILEGLTDYWYVSALGELIKEAGGAELNPKISLVPAASAGKVVYFATILFAQKLRVAALLDSDAAGDQAAKQETLVHTLGNKNILRTKDVYAGGVAAPEIEELLRTTLVEVAKSDLNWDVRAIAASQAGRSIVSIFETEIPSFSKYKLAKAFLRWSRAHTATDLTSSEQTAAANLIELINSRLT